MAKEKRGRWHGPKVEVRYHVGQSRPCDMPPLSGCPIWLSGQKQTPQWPQHPTICRYQGPTQPAALTRLVRVRPESRRNTDRAAGKSTGDPGASPEAVP